MSLTDNRGKALYGSKAGDFAQRGLSNPHLAGGGEQILIPLKYRRVKNPDGTFDFGGIEQSFLDNIVALPDSQIPWK